MNQKRPISPCLSICTIDVERSCTGCYRTLEEIARWSRMSPEEQWAVVRELPMRAGELKSGERPQKTSPVR
jgi:predicted Fe-S protein YdhL (DUF1289 family)